MAAVLLAALSSAAAAVGEPPLGAADFEPSPERPVGWLGDGTGVYPGADPVTHWDPKTGENILWRTEIPGWPGWTENSWEMWCSLETNEIPAWGNGQPIVAGGNVFVTHEPDGLICLDADTGAIRWRIRVGKLDALDPADRRQALAMLEEVRLLNAVWQPKKQEVRRLKQELVSKPDDAALAARIEELNREMREPLTKAYDLFFNRLAPIIGLKGCPWKTLQGYSFATPTSDGTYVYVKYSTGAVACVDMGGRIVWVRAFPWDGSDTGVVSPRLAAGRLIILRKGEGKDRLVATALDPRTGGTVWETAGLRQRAGTASPVPMRLRPAGAPDAEPVTVVVVAGGEVLRASDGKVLAQDVGDFAWGTPTPSGDVLTFCGHPDPKSRAVVAVRLVPAGPDRVEVEPLWTSAGAQTPYNAVIRYQGCVYVWSDAPKGGAPLYVLDATSGRLLGESKPIEPRPGECQGVPVYGNPAVAGGRLYLMDQKDVRFAVLEPGPAGRLLGRMAPLGTTTSSPYFHGNRIYVRTNQYVYCIGPRRAAGAKP